MAAATLQRLAAALPPTPHTILPAPKRAGVAVVLRVFLPSSGRCVGGDGVAGVVAAAGAASDAQLELLLLKRSSRKRDPWSGNMALPGGHRDPGDVSDRAAAERECAEEAGLALAPPDFVFLGALPERPIYRGGAKARGFVMCPYVWLQTAPTGATPPLTLQASEVAAATWCPLAALSRNRVQWDVVRRPLPASALGPAACAAPLLGALGAGTLHFPAVTLPYAGLLPAAGSGRAARPVALAGPPPPPATALSLGQGGASVWAHPAQVQVSFAPVPLATWGGAAASTAPAVEAAAAAAGGEAAGAAGTLEMTLWGLTLGVASDLLATAAPSGSQRPTPLNWPRVAFGGQPAAALSAAVAGAYEVACYPAYGADPLHVAAAAVALTLALAVLAGAAWAAAGTFSP